MTDLTSKAIDIKGKAYILVKDRVLAFNTDYPNGSIVTELLTQPESNRIVIRATVIPDIKTPSRIFTGFSQATVGQGYINETAALENCETSAVGRALAMLGIGVLDSIASVDEMQKAITQQRTPPTNGKPVSGLNMPCSIHGVPMTERMSKKTGKPYFAHNLEDGTFCFGKATDFAPKKPTQRVEEAPEDDGYMDSIADEIPF